MPFRHRALCVSVLSKPNEDKRFILKTVPFDLTNHLSDATVLLDTQTGHIVGKESEMGERIGYARVSSRTQSLGVQVTALERAGCTRIYEEKVSGRSRKGREELKKLLDYVREDDVVYCMRLDRLARSMRDLTHIAAKFEDKGVSLRVLEQNIDTTTSEGKLFFNMLGAFAEFEASIRAERQREGINAALSKGKDSPFKGRPAKIDAERITLLRQKGKTPTAIAKELGIARSSVYRYLDNASVTAR